MPRRPRFVEPGLPHHITQRGNNRETVFLSNSDRQLYLRIVKYRLDLHQIRPLAWCLMTNHIHLVAIPSTPESLGLALGQAHSQYALELNRVQDRVGHLWQNRFFSCSLEAGHLWRAIRYVELNPVRAQMVKEAWEWPWSSAAAHVNPGGRDILLDFEWAGDGEWNFPQWRTALGGREAEEDLAAIRRATQVGEPLGSAGFLERLESKTGRRLRVLKKGRPAMEKSIAVGGEGGLFGFTS